MTTSSFAGVYAAAVTPLKPNLKLDHTGLVELLNFLAGRGCHGALLLGTTGEGTSFSKPERARIFRTALEVKQQHPEFRLLAGVGTPALDETITLTKTAFNLGYDGVVALPPFFFRTATEDGLFNWFSKVIKTAVPSDGALFAYHIPKVAGIGLSLELLERLKDAYPGQFTGLKDSSAELETAVQLGSRFGKDLVILNGTDRLFTNALQAGAVGCITAMANLVSPDHRLVWDAHQHGSTDSLAQARLNQARSVWEKYPPAAATLKMLLHRFYQFPNWSVMPPLLPLSPEVADLAALAWQTRGQVAG